MNAPRESAPTPESTRPRPGRAFLLLMFDMAVPLLLFYVFLWFGLSSFLSLLLSAIAPGLSTVYQVLRSRHLDSMALFMLGITLMTALSSLISGSPRFLLSKDGWVTGLCGIWLLATTRADPPVVFMFARPLLEGRTGPKGVSWTVLWNELPKFRRVWRVASVVWGLATVFDGLIRFAMAYTLPVNEVPALNGVQYAVLFVFLQVSTNVYYFRAGLYNPKSDLYGPLRAGVEPNDDAALPTGVSG